MSLSKMLVAKHAKLAAFVLPTSVAFGFAYTATYGTNPVEDMKNVAVGTRPVPSAFEPSRHSRWPVP